MNKVLLIGRLASKAFEGKTTSNVNYARFTLAVPRQYQTPAGQEPIVDFIPCVA
jgi:Single-strand binding protein family.